MSKENYWNRPCRTLGCYGIARPLSDYCCACHKKQKARKKEDEKN